LIAFQTKKDLKGYNIPHYIDIEFYSENELRIPKNQILINSAATYKNIIKNLLIEEEDLYLKYDKFLEKNDFLSQMVLTSERQGLLTRFIQQITTPYTESLDNEIYNIHNYIIFLQNNNSVLKKKIDQFEKMTNYMD